MKKTKLTISTIVLCFLITNAFAQPINWESLKKEHKHIAHVNYGIEYGAVLGFEYSYQLKYKLPTLLHISYSFPGGDKLFDDFKTTVGGQVNIFRINSFQLTAAVHGVYRRYENPFVRLQNFGSDMKAVFGYYKPRWFVGAEAGFDKAIVTHFKHSNKYSDQFPGVNNGWYEPASGGNFSYGIQAGYSFRQNDITLKLGKTITEDFKTTPLFPIYAQLGYNLRLSKKK
ncbi:MAG: hypothetical protein ACSLE0_07740 [Chitinophagaceae bacterium]